MANKNKSKKVVLSIRVDPEIKKKLEREAAKRITTISMIAEYYLMKATAKSK